MAGRGDRRPTDIELCGECRRALGPNRPAYSVVRRGQLRSVCGLCQVLFELLEAYRENPVTQTVENELCTVLRQVLQRLLEGLERERLWARRLEDE